MKVSSPRAADQPGALHATPHGFTVQHAEGGLGAAPFVRRLHGRLRGLRAVIAGLLLCDGGSAFLVAQPFGFPPAPPPPTRAALLRQYDRNGDGRLDEGEREAMRQARWAEKLKPAAGRAMGFQFPPEVVQEYDADKDGQLDDRENAEAREGIRRKWEKASKDYDKNENGRLDEDELDALRGDIDDGKLPGLPKMFGRRGAFGGGGRRTDPREQILRQADADGDGRLNEAELRVAREGLARLRAVAKPEDR